MIICQKYDDNCGCLKTRKDYLLALGLLRQGNSDNVWIGLGGP
jgi:hypothetical protein